MSEEKPDQDVPESEGWEALEEEAAEGSLAPSAELEEALREAEKAVEERQAERAAPKGSSGLAAELEATQQELAQLRDRHVRLQADFENHRRRGLREREEAHRYGAEKLVKDLLGTVDNLERAITHARASGGSDVEGMVQGVELVHRELLGVFDKHGVTVIEAHAEPFDPEYHEAMAQEEHDDVPPNTVVRVFEKGYRLWDRLLRPARVVVSKPSAGAGAALDEEDAG